MTRALAAALALAFATPSFAHEVLHEVRRGRAVAVRATYADGEPLAYSEAEVFSPADPRIPHWKGRTDRNGWLAFVPDVTGRWRVRVVDTTGHGLDTAVEVDAIGDGLGKAAEGSDRPSLGFQLRPVLGAAVIAAVFGGLYLIGRRRRK